MSTIRAKEKRKGKLSVITQRGLTFVRFLSAKCHRVRVHALSMLNFTTKMNTENKIERTYLRLEKVKVGLPIEVPKQLSLIDD